MRSLGLDIGDRRIGVAVSDPLGMLARPLFVIERVEDNRDAQKIAGLVEEYQVEVLVAGLPLSMDGSIRGQAEKVQQFVEILKSWLKIPVEYCDERFTTVAARQIIESGHKKKKRVYVKKGAYDAAAAAVILQAYLNEKKPLEYPPE